MLLGFDPEDSGRNISCPLLFLTGDNDELVPINVVQSLQKCLAENVNGGPFQVEVFQGFGHAFAHHPQTAEDKVESEKAMEKALLWFQQHL